VEALASASLPPDPQSFVSLANVARRPSEVGGDWWRPVGRAACPAEACRPSLACHASTPVVIVCLHPASPRSPACRALVRPSVASQPGGRRPQRRRADSGPANPPLTPPAPAAIIGAAL
jgi:hypothetical protein